MGSREEINEKGLDITELELISRFAICLALRIHDRNLFDLFELGLVHVCCRWRIGLVERVVYFGCVLEHTF